ncbi:MAG: FMN-binding glutamate synthase family protein [Pseudomonadales bacterium]|nr:FMN-binding glutamate synthase family protein [Pseudomonadales bacterium]
MLEVGTDELVFQIIIVFTALFVFVASMVLFTSFILFFIDYFQTKHTVRRNYPLLGRFRYLLEKLGEFFRQYFYAMDREEQPFNRAQRSWVYRAAKDESNSVPFGSTKDLQRPGTIFFLNSPYPVLEEEATPILPLQIGPFCRTPYLAPSFYNISGMSYGALSHPAVLALGGGAKRAGCWINTGEGGVSPYHLDSGADLVVQIGTAKYGVRDLDGKLSEEKLLRIAGYPQVKTFEIKLSQGAKPGKGGILPANKVTAEVAEIRGIEKGFASHSPNRHPDINSVENLLDMIAMVRQVSGKPCGIKLVLGNADWLHELVKAILLRGERSAPDFITIDGAEGGTGAAPMSLIDSVGLPLRESLPYIISLLEGSGLRGRIKVIASGKLITPSLVSCALAQGADFCVSARGFMFALGCIQALQCDKNTCPTGITTHNRRLQRGLDVSEKTERVHCFHQNMVKEVTMLAHSCGLVDPRELGVQHLRIVGGDGVSKPLQL